MKELLLALIGITLCVIGLVLADIKDNQKIQIANQQIIIEQNSEPIDATNDFGTPMVRKD